MSARRYQTFLQFIRDLLVLNGNRMLGREQIPDPHETLFVETSSMCNLKCRFCPYFKKKSPKSIYLRRPVYKKAGLRVFSMAAFMQLLHSPPDNHPQREREQPPKAA